MCHHLKSPYRSRGHQLRNYLARVPCLGIPQVSAASRLAIQVCIAPWLPCSDIGGGGGGEGGGRAAAAAAVHHRLVFRLAPWPTTTPSATPFHIGAARTDIATVLDLDPSQAATPEPGAREGGAGRPCGSILINDYDIDAIDEGNATPRVVGGVGQALVIPARGRR